MEGLRLLGGPHPPPPPSAGADARAHHPPAQARFPYPRHAAAAAATRPMRRLRPAEDGDELDAGEESADSGRTAGNWVLNILRVRSLWAGKRGGNEAVEMEGGDQQEGSRGGDGRMGCDEEVEEEERMAFDRDSFSRLLRRVSLVEVELYAKMSYLGTLAYNIPNIQRENLLKYRGLRFVTSSLEKKARSSNAEKEQSPKQDQKPEETSGNISDGDKQSENGSVINVFAAYRIAASAASYLQSQTKGILPFSSPKQENDEGESEIASSEVASFVATTNSVTAVVAGKEEMKEAVAKDLNSLHSSPCEWFICDDSNGSTRYFIIQGSDSLASWQANLLFEPIQFEGLDVVVHRGIYEAAKGIYQQMLPEIQAHVKSRGNLATLRFTGHSLGGSLALLVNLMSLIRGDVPLSSLLPVVTFGAPSIICQGDYLLRKLGLPQSHVQAITMHRDIVPRVFSCNYPDHVIRILTAINGNFRNHPFLVNKKLLYDPMGMLLILQPEEKISPHHHLLPTGSGLYLLTHSSPNCNDSSRQLQAAQSAFLNSPHPLEILSDRSAYGSDGTVYRDHDVRAYLRSVRRLIRQELKLVRKAKREGRGLLWWPFAVDSRSLDSGVIKDQRPGITKAASNKFGFMGVFHGGRAALKLFGSMVGSWHAHMFIVILFPVRLLIYGTLSLVSFC